MTDPKRIHDLEQQIAAFKFVAGALSAFFIELVVSGFTREEALELTLNQQSELMRGARDNEA